LRAGTHLRDAAEPEADLVENLADTVDGDPACRRALRQARRAHRVRTFPAVLTVPSRGIVLALPILRWQASHKEAVMIRSTAVLIGMLSISSFVPYATGGVGGLTMFQHASLGINNTDTFLTGNVGGGLKWYAPNGQWGLRGDYRFMATQSNDTAPAFFGQDTRYGHRVYVGVIINAVR
jgi:hypothetical protein